MVVGTIKTLIIGSSGMLGSDLFKLHPDVVKLTHKEVDVIKREQVLKSSCEEKRNLVINTAAYTNVYSCEDNQELAFKVNGHEPGTWPIKICGDI